MHQILNLKKTNKDKNNNNNRLFIPIKTIKILQPPLFFQSRVNKAELLIEILHILHLDIGHHPQFLTFLLITLLVILKIQQARKLDRNEHLQGLAPKKLRRILQRQQLLTHELKLLNKQKILLIQEHLQLVRCHRSQNSGLLVVVDLAEVHETGEGLVVD